MPKNESDDTVSVCGHSLKRGQLLKAELGQAHQCGTTDCAPRAFCHCTPVKIPVAEFQRRAAESGDKTE